MGILYCLLLGVRIFFFWTLTPMDLRQKKKDMVKRKFAEF